MWVVVLVLEALALVGLGFLLWRRRSLHDRAFRALDSAEQLRTYATVEAELLGPPPGLGDLFQGAQREAAPHFLGPGPPVYPDDPLGSAKSRVDAASVMTTAAAVVDGAWPAGGYVLQWAQLDHTFLEAIGHLTTRTVTSVGDLHQAVDHWKALSQLSGPSEALVRQVKGHVAEFMARDHLVDAGHHVAMAGASNNEAWDLDVDGHLMNVKAWADGGAAVAVHAAHYPDHSVVLAGDGGHIPHDALHFDPLHAIDLQAAHEAGASVFVDDALSQVHAAQVAENGLDAAAGNVHVHVPWVTLAVVSFQEVRLLTKGHTDLLRASKNITVTTTAVGGGMTVGAKAGAAIGTFIAPGLGTAIGAVVGGLAGTFAGRKVASSIKEAPLVDAKARYEAAVAAFDAVRGATLEEAGRTWTSFETSTRSALEAEARQVATQAHRSVVSAATLLAATREMDAQEAQRVLADANREVEEDAAAAKAAYHDLQWWRRTLVPDADAAASWARMHRSSERAETWGTSRSLLVASFGRKAPADQVFNLALATPSGETAARTHLAHVARVRISAVEQATRAARSAVDSVLRARAGAVAALAAKQREIVETVNATVEPAVAPLRSARDGLVSELRKAGVAVPV